MAAVIASVEPHVTVTSSAPALIPLNLPTFAAIASLSSREPIVISYWLWSSLIAVAAARFTAAGAEKSGRPLGEVNGPYLLREDGHVPDSRLGEQRHLAGSKGVS